MKKREKSSQQVGEVLSMMVVKVKVYRLNNEYGVQVWFSDGASVRFDGFSSMLDAEKHVSEMWGDVHVVVD